MACAFENERTIRMRSRAASRAATSSSGASSASAASTTSQTGSASRSARPCRPGVVAPVGSFGAQSTTALVSGSTAASASVSGAPSPVSGTGTGAAPASWTIPGSGLQPGQAIATRPPAAMARKAACRSSPAP